MDRADNWLKSNTFHHRQFADVNDLLRRKKKHGVSVSLCIPTLNEAPTIASVVSRLRSELQYRYPLLDEIAVIDSGSTDQTPELAAAAGADVYQAAEILPQLGRYCGKGENLWKAVYQLRGDIIVTVDGDISNMHPRFITGLLGPLLHHPEIGYVKAFYDRSCSQPGEDVVQGGGRVTEILIRPLFSLYFPELTAVIQPLSGEYAVRRTILEQLAFPVGYGVETAHLIDVYDAFGLTALAQTDLEQRCHRNRTNRELGKMSFAIMQVLTRRLQRRGVLLDVPTCSDGLRQFHPQHRQQRQEIHRIVETERPPMQELLPYRQKRAGKGQEPFRARQLLTGDDNGPLVAAGGG
jgi:glucosyl-3-phosphoglycerate synthase